MDAFAAIPILEQKVAELEVAEPSWTNCPSCPFSGKCCDGATLLLFPEENLSLLERLSQDTQVLQYALSRFSEKKPCYFYDKQASSCRIHYVRPLNCRWTPYAEFQQSDGRHSLHVRSAECDFTKRVVDATPMAVNQLSVDNVSPGANKIYLSWQSISELHPLMQRSAEMISLESVMSELASKHQPA